MAILPTGFGKSLIFQVFAVARSKQNLQSSNIIVICPLQNIVNDQIIEEESFGLSAKSLDCQDKKSSLNDIPQLLFASAEAVLSDDTFMLLKNDSFRQQIKAVVVDESYTTETWTGERYCIKIDYGIAVLLIIFKYFSLRHVLLYCRIKKQKQKEHLSHAFSGAYGELSILRSFCKESNFTSYFLMPIMQHSEKDI